MLLHFYASVQTLLRCGYEHSSSKASNEAIPKPYQWSGQAEQEADQIESRNKILQAFFRAARAACSRGDGR